MSDIIYVTYLTSYYGNKLPPFYIGSSTLDKIINGYRGTVKSKKYKTIWARELKATPHLFKTQIISKHTSRKLALEKELFFQRSLNVVKSSLYINMALATTNGCFGRDVSGINNPFYRMGYKNLGDKNPNYGKRMTNEQKKKIRETKIKLYSKTICFINPQGIKYIHKGIITFCEEHELSYACMRKVIEGKNKTHRGWTAHYA